MKDLSVLSYRNIFPSDISRAGHLLLCLLYYSCPFHRNSLLYLLKPVMGDKQAAELLRTLVGKGYLYVANTGCGKFYALTAKSVGYIDIEGTRKPYRCQKIAKRLLVGYWLQSHIIASALCERAFAICKEQGGFPKSKGERAAVLAAMSSAISRFQIPFVEGYNEWLYKSVAHPLMKRMQQHEIAQRSISQQAAGLNALRTRADTDPSAAEAYQEAFAELTHTAQAAQSLLPQARLLTYTHGLKVLSLEILQQNGIFLERIDNVSITFGLLDNVAYGVSSRRLAMRFDYIITLADALGLFPTVNIYTLETGQATLSKRVAQLKPPYLMPTTIIKSIPLAIRSRKAYAGSWTK